MGEISIETLLKSVRALEAEREALRAEVAKLKAACAAKDAALRDLIVLADSAMADANKDCGEYDRVGELREARAALATDAGRNWIDATGAVEGYVVERSYGQYADVQVPDDWAGRTVLVMVKP